LSRRIDTCNLDTGLAFRIYRPKNFKIYRISRFYWKNLAKVTGPNEFSLAVGHRTTAKVDDCSYTWICSTWHKMSKLHVGDIASYMYVSVICDKKLSMLHIGDIPASYMYLLYVTKNVCVTYMYWWYGYMYVNCKSAHYLMLHIHVSVLWDKQFYVIYIGDTAIHACVLCDKKCPCYILVIYR
jgi:hypothetical protein